MEDGALKQGVISQIKGVYIIYTPLMCRKLGRFPTRSFLSWFIVNPAIWCIKYIHQVIYWMLKKERPIPSL